VCRMEDVLDLYEQEYDPAHPVVCFDEMPVQLVGETRATQPVGPGRPERYDYEYRRNGTANLFLHFEPGAGRRYVDVTDRRTKVDFAGRMKALVDERYPDAAVIRVVLDQLNTHGPASLYEAFEPAEARRILRRLEFHHTPKHASWLRGGGDRVLGAVGPVPRQTHPGYPDAEVGGRGVAGRAQRSECDGRVALHQRGRPRQAPPPLPSNIMMARY